MGCLDIGTPGSDAIKRVPTLRGTMNRVDTRYELVMYVFGLNDAFL